MWTLLFAACDAPPTAPPRWVLCAGAGEGAPDDDGDPCGSGEVTSADACQRYWGGEVGTELGSSVTGLGDLDGDGAISVAVSAPGACGNRGAAFLFRPWSGGAPARGTTPLSEAGAAIVLPDPEPLDSWHRAHTALPVGSAGDVDGDGHGDILVLSTYLERGDAFLLLGPFAGEHVTTDAVATLSGLGAWPRAAAPAGDQDGDGLPDLAFGTGAPRSTGGVTILPGTARGDLTDVPPIAQIEALPAPNKPGRYARFGTALAGGDDLDGDGLADLVVGIAHPDGGYAAWFPGPLTGDLTLRDAAGVVVPDPGHSALLGTKVATAGDVDGDGIADLLVADPEWAVDEEDWAAGGAAALYRGPLTGVVAFSNATARIVPSSRYFDGLGAAVAGAGDVDGDGFGDVLVGAPGYGWDTDGDGDLCAGPGATWVFRGPLAGNIDDDDAAAGIRGRTGEWCGPNLGDAAGASAAGAGDVNGDGFADILVGAPGYAGEDEGMDDWEDHDRGLAWLVLGAPL